MNRPRRSLLTHAIRFLPVAIAAACPLVAAGCADSGATTIDRPAPTDAPIPGHDTSTTSNVSMVHVAETGGGDPTLAEVAGTKVTQSEVLPALIESYGLDVLLKVMQRDMAKAEAAREGLTISNADVEREREIVAEQLSPGGSPEDHAAALKNLLERQHVSDTEFNIVMQTNAYLRALSAKPAAAQITEDMIRTEFNANYGERIRVRHIALANMQEVADARARLAAGQRFEDVARNMSRYALTARTGGELPPFSRLTPGIGKAFANAAFTLTTPDEVSSDTVHDGPFFHIIQLIERIPPTVVKYEDVHDSVRAGLLQRMEQVGMTNLRNEMAERARRDLIILDPTLKKQFADRLTAANPNTPTTRDAAQDQIDWFQEMRNAAATRNATTAPSVTPSHVTTTHPVTGPSAPPSTAPVNIPSIIP